MTLLSERFDQALLYASRVHHFQTRKGSETPYLAHLLGCSAIVLEAGGNEDQAIAALLHDAAEDQGGQAILDQIEEKFGKEVARIVLACSDSLEQPKPDWKTRKERYLAHLEEADEAVLRVSLADKIYNAESILADLLQGLPVFDRFKGGREGTLWYYRSLDQIFSRSGAGLKPLSDRLHRAVLAIGLKETPI